MSFKEHLMLDAVQYNRENNLPLTECVFRRESEAFYNYFLFLKQFKDSLEFEGYDLELIESDIGTFGEYNGEEVALDLPFLNDETNDLQEAEYKGKDVELDSPKRNPGEGKKYYVYTKNDKGNVIKIYFGDVKGGLTAKINDEQARKSFAARHNCEEKNDKTKPGYWACRLPYYASQLGLSGGGKYWW